MEINEEKAENTPAGGVLMGKKDGQTIIHDKGTMSGYLVGKLHRDGGIQAVNKTTGQPLEMQGGEVVITAPAVSDQTKREFEGKMMTNREILSAINEKGGGVSFANGGDIPAKINTTDTEFEFGGKMVHDTEIANHLGMNSTLKKGKQHFTSGNSTYDVDAIYNAIKKGKIAYKTKDITPFAMKNPVYDKKYSETVKVDSRKPNGIMVRLENGEEVLIDGNHRMNNAYLKGRKNFKVYYINNVREIAKFTKNNNFELGGDVDLIYKNYNDKNKAEAIREILNKAQIRFNFEQSHKNNSHYWTIDGSYYRISDHSKPEGAFGYESYKNKEGKKDFRNYNEFYKFLKQKYDLSDKSELEKEYKKNAVKFLKEINLNGVKAYEQPDGSIFSTIDSALNNMWKTNKKYNLKSEKFELGGENKVEGHLSKGKSLKQIAEMHNVSLTHINEQLAKGLEVEKEHFADFKERTRIAKDHLVENPNYYSILAKAGLKKGGHLKPRHKHEENLVRDAEDGNTPARDLNNYNDLLDVQADGEVGGDSGIDMDGAYVADASGAVGTFANGGIMPYDANSEGDSASILSTGGGVDPIYVDKITIAKDLRQDKAYKGFVGREYYRFEDLKKDLKSAIEEENKLYPKRTNNGGLTFTVNDEESKISDFWLEFNDKKKNTVANFNPETGKNSDLEKQLANRKKVSFKKYDWSGFLLGKNSKSSNILVPSPSNSIEKITINYKVKLTGSEGMSISLCPYDLIVNLREFANGEYENITLQPSGVNVNQLSKKIDISTQTFKDMIYQKDKVAEVDIMSNLEFTMFPDLNFRDFIMSDKCMAKPNKIKGSFDFANTKIWIDDNPELSEKIQKLAFENGYEWANGAERRPIATDEPALVFSEFGLIRKITYRANRSKFDEE